MPPEKFLGLIFRPVGQQRDAEKVFLTRELDRVIEQFRTVAVPLELLMDHEVLEQNDETAFCGANGKEEIDHADNRAVAAKHEYATATRLFENQTQPAQLPFFIWPKIALLCEESSEHFGQLIQISLGSRLNDDFLAHRLYCLFQKLSGLATREWKLDRLRPTKLTIPCPILM